MDTRAFPRESYGAINQPGMTLRDYFAAAALQGFCANHAILLAAKQVAAVNNMTEAETLAVAVGAYADAMIAEREKRDA